jgi:hypothetical protein
MGLPRTLSENDVERLLAGRAPADGDPSLEEVAVFVRALGAAVPEATDDPDPALISRLAETAAAGAGSPYVHFSVAGKRRSPARLVARVGIAAAMVPALFAGLAYAGVNLPGPADDAFDSVGLELPNQSDSAASDDAPGDKGGSDATAADDKKDSNGKGEANRRTNRKAYGPSRSAQPNPPANAVRRGPNPSPGTPPGKPDSLPSTGSNAGGNGNGNANANGGGSAQGQSKSGRSS